MRKEKLADHCKKVHQKEPMALKWGDVPEKPIWINWK